MPTSEKQIQANRQNAQRSTGPTTDAGIQTSSRNALTHGILAREVVITHPGYQESQDDFDTLLSQLHDDWRPEGPREQLLLQQIATCYWRLRRILHADSLEFGKTLAQLQEPPDTMDYLGKIVTLYPPSLPPAERLDLILRYEKSLTQQLFRATKELERLQQQRRQEAASSPAPVPLPDDPSGPSGLPSSDDHSQHPPPLPSPAISVGRSRAPIDHGQHGRLWPGDEGAIPASPTHKNLRNEPITQPPSTPVPSSSPQETTANAKPAESGVVPADTPVAAGLIAGARTMP